MVEMVDVMAQELAKVLGLKKDTKPVGIVEFVRDIMMKPMPEDELGRRTQTIVAHIGLMMKQLDQIILSLEKQNWWDFERFEDCLVTDRHFQKAISNVIVKLKTKDLHPSQYDIDKVIENANVINKNLFNLRHLVEKHDWDLAIACPTYDTTLQRLLTELVDDISTQHVRHNFALVYERVEEQHRSLSEALGCKGKSWDELIALVKGNNKNIDIKASIISALAKDLESIAEVLGISLDQSSVEQLVEEIRRLKSISQLKTENAKEIIAALGLSEHATIEEILKTIRNLKDNDKDEIIRSKASVIGKIVRELGLDDEKSTLGAVVARIQGLRNLEKLSKVRTNISQIVEALELEPEQTSSAEVLEAIRALQTSVKQRDDQLSEIVEALGLDASRDSLSKVLSTIRNLRNAGDRPKVNIDILAGRMNGRAELIISELESVIKATKDTVSFVDSPFWKSLIPDSGMMYVNGRLAALRDLYQIGVRSPQVIQDYGNALTSLRAYATDLRDKLRKLKAHLRDRDWASVSKCDLPIVELQRDIALLYEATGEERRLELTKMYADGYPVYSEGQQLSYPIWDETEWDETDCDGEESDTSFKLRNGVTISRPRPRTNQLFDEREIEEIEQDLEGIQGEFGELHKANPDDAEVAFLFDNGSEMSYLVSLVERRRLAKALQDRPHIPPLQIVFKYGRRVIGVDRTKVSAIEIDFREGEEA